MLHALFHPNATWREYALQDGSLAYCEHFLSHADSQRFYGLLLHNISWRQEPITLFGRRVMQPRLTAWYGDEGRQYRYSGITMRPQPWTDELLQLKSLAETACGAQFNSVLLNYYRHGNDSMGWHSDDEPELGINPVIASVSLGAERPFCMRHRLHRHLRLRLTLGNGSLLVMKNETQHYWQHALPKQPRLTQGRINLTFRYIIA
ncbi:MAG: alpha-ketoglutarate-dependent dioxygenase AlkB [Chitinophagales bacterium]|nr:alpha-ketoglutarate-dependent dioxygenase AlkB [Chitinophagales bacterium]MDW8419846.1 alpha-ketoglutarate-dependent dioxygenase AlkB [Chitinophagales bacterium]